MKIYIVRIIKEINIENIIEIIYKLVIVKILSVKKHNRLRKCLKSVNRNNWDNYVETIEK